MVGIGGAYRCCECRSVSLDGLFEEPAGLDARMWCERASAAAGNIDVGGVPALLCSHSLAAQNSIVAWGLCCILVSQDSTETR